jgi:hypothetical protein
MKPVTVLLIVMIIPLLLATPAEAALQYFTNESEWATATSGVFTIDFEDVSVDNPPGFNDYSIGGLQLHGVDFQANPESAEGLEVCSVCEQGDSFAGNYLRGNTWGTKFIQATLPTDAYALSLLVLTDPRGSTVTFTFSTGSYVMTTYSDAVPDFIGFISDVPLQWVRIGSDATNTVLVDNFAYGALAEADTPEPGTLLLGGLGFAALAAARLLRRARNG